jgi:hypothetical protein
VLRELLRDEDEPTELLLRDERCAATDSTVHMVSRTAASGTKNDNNIGLRRLAFIGFPALGRVPSLQAIALPHDCFEGGTSASADTALAGPNRRIAGTSLCWAAGMDPEQTTQ